MPFPPPLHSYTPIIPMKSDHSVWQDEQIKTANMLMEQLDLLLSSSQMDAASHRLAEIQTLINMTDDSYEDKFAIGAILELYSARFAGLNLDLEAVNKHQKKAIELFEKVFPNRLSLGIDYANAYLNLINKVFGVENTSTEAQEYVDKAISIFEKVWDSPETDKTKLETNMAGFRTWVIHADIMIATHQFEEANKSIEKALRFEDVLLQEVAIMLQSVKMVQSLAMLFFNEEELDSALRWGMKSDEMARKAFEKEKEASLPFFVQTQLFLILFHEKKGNFDAAEDALFNAIDVLGNHPQVLDRGRIFYQQCAKYTDKLLIAGGLPREEVEDGLKEIMARIEAFGGEEKLNEALEILENAEETTT